MPETGYHQTQYYFMKLPKNSAFAILYRNNILYKNNLNILQLIFEALIEDKHL